MRRPGSGHRLRPGRGIRFTAVAVIMLALAVLAASCDSGSSDSAAKSTSKSTTTTATTAPIEQAAARVGAEAAVAKYLQSQGYQYGGDCSTATVPADQGMWCSTLVSGDNTTNTKTYGIGPVGEQPQKQITLTRHGAAQLTPGFQVPVADGNVGQVQQLTKDQLQADTFITSNLLLDQAAGIGNGLSDLPAGATTGTGEGGGGGTGGTTGPPTQINQAPDTVDPAYPPGTIIVVTDPNVVVGGEAEFRGGGCGANEVLAVSFDNTQTGTITADSGGNFAGSLPIPPGTAPGNHLVTVQGAVCVLNANVNVLGANLAFTGSSTHTGTYVLGAVAAIAVGLVLVVGTRRRRRGVRHRSLPPPSGA